jgi:thiamine-monophosphate kinase
LPPAPSRESLAPSDGPLVGDVGEQQLLELLRPYLATAAGLELGAGDDAAIWQPGDGTAVVVTTDSMVEEVHFHTPADSSAATAVGWKLLAVSYSDLAAMGASPGVAVVALSLPAAWPVARVTAMYEGISELMSAFGGGLAGGNISAASTAVLTSTCLGEVEPARAMRRSGAEAGWGLALTGDVGGAAAALRVAHDPDAIPRLGEAGPAAVDEWQRRLRRPEPRLVAAARAAAGGIMIAIDVSDGLFIDAGRLLTDAGAGASGRTGAANGVVIDADKVPLARGVREAWPDAWPDVAGGGEDYELLLAGPERVLREAVTDIRAAGTAASIIGRFDDVPGVRLLHEGVEGPAPGVGHQHFA